MTASCQKALPIIWHYIEQALSVHYSGSFKMAVLKETPQDETNNCGNCMNCMRRVSQVTLTVNITRLSLPSYDGLKGFGTPPPYGQHQGDKLESHAEVFVFEAAFESHSGTGGWAKGWPNRSDFSRRYNGHATGSRVPS